MKRLSPFFLSLFLFHASLYSQTRGEIWGVTRDGGQGNGVIFKIDTAGKQQMVFEFPFRSKGYALANEFCETNDGILYGATYWGGIKNCGAIIRYNTKTGTYAKKADFTDDNGKEPAGRLVAAKNGKLYGLTNKGGTYGGGTLFEYDPLKNKLNSKVHFKDSLGYAAYGTLTLAQDGLLYGSSLQGGKYGGGVIFSYNPRTSAYRVRYNFNNENSTGNTPCGSMVEANKKLYGFTGYGSGHCILFEFDPLKNKCIKKLVFPSGVGARYSCNGMILYNGKLYGIADKDFAPNSGFLFEYNPATNKLKILKNFRHLKGQDPVGILAVTASGKFYGLTRGIGNYSGILFEFDPLTLDLKVKYRFNEKAGGPPQSIMISSNGNLYGATGSGGPHGMGGIFEFESTTSILRTKCWLSASSTGEQIAYGLASVGNGKLYGIMGMGGEKNGGVLFEFDPVKKSLVRKVDFSNKTGRAPIGELLVSSAGKIYGTTCYGGKFNQGTLYEFDPALNKLQIKFHFNNATKNRVAILGLAEGPNGKFYGITSEGAASREGILYEFDPANDSFREIEALKESRHGNITFTGISCINGKIYTWLTSHYESATVFLEYDPATDSIRSDIKISPYGDWCLSKILVERKGRIYGFCRTSDPQSQATVLFEYDPVTRKLDEKYIISADCVNGYLLLGSDGMLYGSLAFSGPAKLGGTFKYDPATGKFTAIADFLGPNGARPYGKLIEVKP